MVVMIFFFLVCSEQRMEPVTSAQKRSSSTMVRKGSGSTLTASIPPSQDLVFILKSSLFSVRLGFFFLFRFFCTYHLCFDPYSKILFLWQLLWPAGGTPMWKSCRHVKQGIISFLVIECNLFRFLNFVILKWFFLCVCVHVRVESGEMRWIPTFGKTCLRPSTTITTHLPSKVPFWLQSSRHFCL